MVAPGDSVKREVAGVAFVAAGVFGFFALWTDSTGIVGQALARVLKLLWGHAAPVFLIAVIANGASLLAGRAALGFGLRHGCVLACVALFSAIFHLPITAGMELEAGRAGYGGGIAGALLVLALRKGFGETGQYVVLGTSWAIAILLGVAVSIRDWPKALRSIVQRGSCLLGGRISGPRAEPEAEAEIEEREETFPDGEGVLESTIPPREEMTLLGHGFVRKGARPPAAVDQVPEGARSAAGDSRHERGSPALRGSSPPTERARVHVAAGESSTLTSARLPEEQDRRVPPPAFRPAEPGCSTVQATLGEGAYYELPPIDIFKKPAPEPKRKSEKSLKVLAKQMESTLESFGVSVKVVGISKGPAVTRFEAHPGPGVKVSQVVRLADDIALSLATPQVRVEAPIPGKSAIGIEVPNKEVSVVHLREVLESPEFQNSNSPLCVAIGKDISGKPIVAGLDRMLHLLIAGATGSGKSVCVNSIISSLLYRCRPDRVKFIMVDPKVVELSVYNGIPHLLAPVVTDPKKAAGCLKWVVKEMMRRYEMFADAGVKDISSYNRFVAEEKLKRAARPGLASPTTPRPEHRPAGPPLTLLPYIVVVIDELADLMMVSPAEVEDCIFRLAQMARAAGIHLVVATQRPSTDVITGTIKANIPSRVAFAVSSHVDSRTIIDTVGAEKLIGRGDMLFSPVWATKPVRAQGCYVSEAEVQRLVKFVSSQAAPEYVEDMLKIDEGDGSGEADEAEMDELFPKAVRVVVEHGQASTSLLQRKLRIGYTRAARLIDVMEERGFIGAYDGMKPREVFLTMEEYQRIFGFAEGRSKAKVKS